MHVVVTPLALINATVGPLVGSEAANFIECPLAGVLGAIDPLIEALAVLLPLQVIALIFAAVGPRLNA